MFCLSNIFVVPLSLSLKSLCSLSRSSSYYFRIRARVSLYCTPGTIPHHLFTCLALSHPIFVPRPPEQTQDTTKLVAANPEFQIDDIYTAMQGVFRRMKANLGK